MILLGLLFILLGNISCNSDDSSNNQNSLLGTWELVQFEDQTTTIIMNDLDNFGLITITFEDEEFEGTTGSNIFFGDYIVESEVLIFLKFGISEVNESEWGQKFGDAIVSTYNSNDNNYRLFFILQENILKIEYKPTEFMYFERQ